MVGFYLFVLFCFGVGFDSSLFMLNNIRIKDVGNYLKKILNLLRPLINYLTTKYRIKNNLTNGE